MTNLTKSYDFVYFYAVENGNPNGDPDSNNRPRCDEETDDGLVTDVCLKHKIRAYVEILKGLEAPYNIFYRTGNYLNDLISDAMKTASEGKKKNGSNSSKTAPELLCEQYYDLRAFGAMTSTGEKDENSSSNQKGVNTPKGAITLYTSKSIDPIETISCTITRCCTTSKNGNNNTMGVKHIVPFAIYRQEGRISAINAAKTGFSKEDLDLFFQALLHCFDHDGSAARGKMYPVALIVFEHSTALGDAFNQDLYKLVKVTKKEGVEYPRSVGDYDFVIKEDKIPSTIKMSKLYYSVED